MNLFKSAKKGNLVRRLIFIGILLSFITIGIGTPTWVNSYGGETLGNAALAGLASCAFSEAWKGMKNEPQQRAVQQPQPMRSEVRISVRQSLFDKCDARFPRESDDANFLRCLDETHTD